MIFFLCVSELTTQEPGMKFFRNALPMAFSSLPLLGRCALANVVLAPSVSKPTNREATDCCGCEHLPLHKVEEWHNMGRQQSLVLI